MKKVLLIGGGGTLGTYTARELLELDFNVDIICLEDKISQNKNLNYYKCDANLETLKEFLKDRKYNGIVNFIHYPDVEVYQFIHELLISKTEHLIVLSSYRVYANEQIPVTETAPKLLDISKDKEFLKTEKYALSKAKLEKYLYNERKGEHWTVVRPVISFSKLRFDLVTYYGYELFELFKKEKPIPLPIEAKNLTAGIDWAGNVGKLIANLLLKPETFCEAYTVSSAQNLTWGEVAKLYEKNIGAKFEWVSTKEFLEAVNYNNYYTLIYDRLFDRKIDNSKILKATGLTKSDFFSIEDGLKIELELLKDGNV
ncbi:MAG: hypothetical protein E7537_04160 [Ruminococcaceae bacterium]|nr:hypothetical protein [Oscillospiraceae bacterium]